MNSIELTEDQNELLEHLDNFIENNKLYFGVYGPAGSGKSFTIGYFILSNKIYTQTLFSGTTHNACKVLRESILNSTKNNFQKLFKDKEILKTNIQCDSYENKEYINIHDVKNIDDFIIECSDLLFLRYKMQFKTIHSIFTFEQSRDDKHNVIFVPKNSIYIISTLNDKKKYLFYPKFTVSEKEKYNLLCENDKKKMEFEYYRDEYKHFTGCKIIICDESSMLKEFEFEYIKYICKILKVKIIFLGDKYQLPPVDDIQINENENVDFKNLSLEFFIEKKLV